MTEFKNQMPEEVHPTDQTALGDRVEERPLEIIDHNFPRAQVVQKDTSVPSGVDDSLHHPLTEL